MAAGDAYATVAQYKARVDPQKGASADDVIEEQLLMASRFFDLRLGMTFNLDASVTSRVYIGDGSRALRLLSPIASTAGLVVKRDTDNDGDFSDETALTLNTDFELWPLGAASAYPVQPWTQLYIPDWAPSYGSWYNGYRFQVTALHGWPAVPEILRDLVCEWVAVWRGESIRTTARVSELDQVTDVSPYHLSQLKRMERLLHPTGGVVVG